MEPEAQIARAGGVAARVLARVRRRLAAWQWPAAARRGLTAWDPWLAAWRRLRLSPGARHLTFAHKAARNPARPSVGLSSAAPPPTSPLWTSAATGGIEGGPGLAPQRNLPPKASHPPVRRRLPNVRRWLTYRLVSTLFLIVGGLFIAGAVGYGVYAGLNTWLMAQDRFVLARGIAPLAIPTRIPVPPPLPTATPMPSATVTPRPTSTPTPVPIVSAQSQPPPVQVSIPAIGVSRSIIALPASRTRTGLWTWNTRALFRQGRPDLVGHWTASANPGEAGNVVLVGHNFGYGYNGVFVSLGRLRSGQLVTVVNKAGKTFTYKVTKVKRVGWRKQDFAELTEHLTLLAPGGSERLTLVSCAGADIEPFPERIYVVAVPVN